MFTNFYPRFERKSVAPKIDWLLKIIAPVITLSLLLYCCFTEALVMTSMSIKTATFATDRSTLFEIINDAYKVEIGDSGVAFKSMPRMVSIDRITESDFCDQKGVLKMCTSDESQGTAGEVMGCIFYEIKEDSVYFGPFAVSPQHAGKGIGKTLLRAVIDIGKKHELQWCELYCVNHRSDLINISSKWGFEVFGDNVPYPVPDRLTRPSHFVRMRKLLTDPL